MFFYLLCKLENNTVFFFLEGSLSIPVHARGKKCETRSSLTVSTLSAMMLGYVIQKRHFQLSTLTSL